MITPEQADILDVIINSYMGELHVFKPCVVQSVDNENQKCDVEIQVENILEKSDGSYTTEKYPVLKNIPYEIRGSSEYVTAYSVSPGDTGLVLFFDTSIDKWLSNQGTVSPGDVGVHTLTGGLFVPGFRKNSSQITDDLSSGAFFGKIGGAQVRVNDSNIEATSSGNKNSTGGYVALADKVDDFISRFHNVMTAWVPPTGSPDSGAALKTAYTQEFALPPEATGCTNLKADE